MTGVGIVLGLAMFGGDKMENEKYSYINAYFAALDSVGLYRPSMIERNISLDDLIKAGLIPKNTDYNGEDDLQE